MIVLAESNFVLELGFQQEQAGEAERIVSLAEARRIQLGIPACSFTEPYQTLVRRLRERRQLIRAIRESFGQVGRSRGLKDLVASAEGVLETLAQANDAERQGVGETVHRLIACCRVQVLTDAIIRTAYEFEAEFKLDPHDAVVLASIEMALRDADAGEKLFVNKNSEDFDSPGIKDLLASYGCKLITNFADARRFVENRVAAERAA